MSVPGKVWLEGNAFFLSGPVDFGNADAICRDGLELLAAAGPAVTVDLSGMEGGGSVMVAVLLQWLRASASAGRHLRIVGLTDKLHAIIRVSGLQDLIPES